MTRESVPARDKVHGMTPKDLARVNKLLIEIGGPNVSWGAASILEVWIAETRMESERRSAHRLVIATWALALMTLGLVAATVGLIVVTLTSG